MAPIKDLTHPTICSIEGCDKPRHRRCLMCVTHYLRKAHYGDPLYAPRQGRLNDVTGNRYGILVVQKLANRDNNITRWLCLCDCGRTTIILASNLTSGHSKSCGKCSLIPRGGRKPRITNPVYRTVHTRLVQDLGPASSFTCVDCSGPALHWSYNHSDPTPMYSPEGMAYSTDPDCYEPRCALCHKAYDKVAA